ncbi:MAG: hypothetical protein ACK41O_18315 [Runella zeae]
MTGEEKIQMISDHVEGILNGYEAGELQKAGALEKITWAILEWVFQEAYSWAVQVNEVNWVTKDAYLNPDNSQTVRAYKEAKLKLNDRVKVTFELASKLEQFKKGGQNE